MQKKNNKKTPENIDPNVSATGNGKTMNHQTVLYEEVKNLNLLKKTEAKGLLSNLGIRTFLSKIPILGDVLF